MADSIPTSFFGFVIDGRNERLHQMWVTADGVVEWKPVPYIQIDGVKRSDSIAGWVSDDVHERD